MTNTLQEIAVEELHPHPKNPRKVLGDLSELAASIKANGVMQNLTVVPDDEGYTVVIGHRRLAAAKQAGLETVPCAVVTMDEKTQLAVMLTENVQRSDLTVQEQAQGFQLILNLGETVESVSKSTGFSESTVRRRLKLLELDQDLLMRAESRGGTLRDYEQLNRIKSPELRNQALAAVGTANFGNELKKALNEEKQEKRWQEMLAEAASFATQIEKRGVIDGEETPMVFAASWSRFGGLKDKPTDGGVYYYIVEDERFITFYKPVTAEIQKEQAEQEERRTRTDRREKELMEIADRHRQLRFEFIRGLRDRRRFGRREWDAVMEMAFETLLLYQTRHVYINGDAVMEMLDIDENEEDQAAVVRTQYQEKPDYTLLALCYATLDQGAYWNKTWVNGEYRIERRECPTLDTLYSLLAALGYEMSDEEQQIQNGTHPLLTEGET